MILRLVPLVPSQAGCCWSVCAVNDGAAPVEKVELESVDYGWGDVGNLRQLKTTFGPIAPGAELEIYREKDTEVSTSLTLRVDGDRYYAELGKLYPPKGRPPRTITLQPLGQPR